MLISPLAHKLMSISRSVHVLLCADDLLIIITGEQDQAVFMFLLSWVKAFSRYRGLCVNLSKSALLLKGHWTEANKVQLLSTGLRIQKSYKYLGIQFGDVTAEESFSHALQKATGRAFAMQTWALSLPERIQLLKLWILPLLVYPARAVFPSAAVVSTLTTIYHIALNLNSWWWWGSGPKTHWGMRLLDKMMILQGVAIQPLEVGYANRPKKGGYVVVSPICVLACL